MARHIWVDGDGLTSTRLNAFPGGVVSHDAGVSQSSITTVVDMTGLSVTFTAETGRLYRTTLFIPRLDQITTTAVVTGIIANGSSTLVNSAVVTIASGQFGSLTVVHYESAISGSTTRKGRLQTSAGSVNVVGTPYLTVEDLGVA